MGILVVLFFLLLFCGAPIAYVLLFSSSVGILAFSSTPPIIILQQIYQGLDTFTLLAVPLFIISGSIAAKGGTARGLINIMRLFLGKLPGGLAMATIFACAIFAAISGSSLATIMAIGSLMIPTLHEEGYPHEMGVGLVTAGGSLGILIPPSVPMVIFCVAMGTSVGKQFMAGFVPGILLAVCWCVYILIVSIRKGYPDPSRALAERKMNQKVTGRELLEGIPALLFPVIILGSIYGGWATPTEAAAISIVYVVLIEKFIYKTLKLRELPGLFAEGVVNSATILFILGCAQVLNYFITAMQIPALLSQFISSAMHSKFLFILLFLIICMIAGCFIDIVALIVVLGPLLKPSLEAFGVDPIHFGIICVMATQVGQITPPFGVNLFVSMRITKYTMAQTIKCTMPYLIILAVFTLLVAYIPSITLFLPGLMK